MSDKRILITGAAGYLGHQLGRQLAVNYPVIGTDIRPRQRIGQDLEQSVGQRVDLGFPLEMLDVRDPSLAQLLKQQQITHVVHLASVLQASSDRQRDFDIDVNGTRNVLAACLQSRVRHLTVSSSGAAYGYHPDNPEWIDEDDPLRGNPEFAYADHKRQVEELLAEYRHQQPQLKQLIFRPGTILGTETRNQITRLFFAPRLLAIRGSASPFVFIWDQDVLAAIEQGIREDRSGRYNMAGDGTLTLAEIAQRLNKPLIELPAALVKTGLWLARCLGQPVGPEQVNFLRYRPVLSNRRLKEEFGYRLQKSSAETFDYFIQQARLKGDL